MYHRTVEAAQVPTEKSEPARAASFVADVGVPLVQAAITGGILSGLLTWCVAEIVPDYGGSLFKFWCFWALVVGSFAWLVLLLDTRRLLWALERVVGVDLDQNGQVGEPRERVVVLNAGRGQVDQDERDDRERLGGFASFVARLPHKGTSLRAWESELGRDVYAMYRDSLIEAGFARWRSDDKKQGWELTVSVREVLSRLAE